MPVSWRYKQAASVLRRGGVIAYPTEAVWGLGCDPFNPTAVGQLLALKNRSVEQGLILVAAHLDQFADLIAPLSAIQLEQLEASWPGFTTWLVPASGRVPEWIAGRHSSVALRVSAHPLVQDLCRAFGAPIVSTSANPSGRPPAKTDIKVAQYFGSGLDLVVPGQLGGASSPSPIRDLASGESVRGI